MTMPELPCTVVCPECPRRVECSAEDPDAGMDQMWGHIYWDHAFKAGRSAPAARVRTYELLAKVTVVPDA